MTKKHDTHLSVVHTYASGLIFIDEREKMLGSLEYNMTDEKELQAQGRKGDSDDQGQSLQTAQLKRESKGVQTSVIIQDSVMLPPLKYFSSLNVLSSQRKTTCQVYSEAKSKKQQKYRNPTWFVDMDIFIIFYFLL